MTDVWDLSNMPQFAVQQPVIGLLRGVPIIGFIVGVFYDKNREEWAYLIKADAFLRPETVYESEILKMM